MLLLRGVLLPAQKPASLGSPVPASQGLRLMILVMHTGSGSLGARPLKGSSWQPCVPGLKGPEGPPFLSPVCHCLSLSPSPSGGLLAAPWTLTQVCAPP